MIKVSSVLSALIASSMLMFALRGKAGAVVITICILAIVLFQITQRKIKTNYCFFYAIYVFIFAVILHYTRSYSFEYYLLIGYLAASILLLNSKLDLYNKLWPMLGYISIFQAVGIYMQWFLPSVYYSILSIILPSSVVSAIKGRLVAGYYTGFCREVSYSMFFIVIGLGIYIFKMIQHKNGILSAQIKRFLGILFLLGALILSGKRATLLFFVVTIFTILFIKSRDRLKFFKYMAWCIGFIIVIYLTYPLWSKIPSLARIVELLEFISEDDLVGITNGRIAIYEKAIELWKSNPIYGIGWGNFKYSISESIWYSGFDVHNCYLQILCETGIIGAVFYYGLTIFAIINLIRCILVTRETKNNHNLALLAGFIQIFFSIYCITEPILYEYSDYIIYFIAINVSCLILKETKKYNKYHRHQEGNINNG